MRDGSMVAKAAATFAFEPCCAIAPHDHVRRREVIAGDGVVCRARGEARRVEKLRLHAAADAPRQRQRLA